MRISNYNKKEWNLEVLTIVSSLDYEEWILSYLCGNGPSLKYRLYVLLSVDNFIKFSTHNQITKAKKKTNKEI